MVCKILLVGTGITSAVCASLLRKKFQNGIHLVIWDKAKGIGGRMSTSRSPYDSKCIADLGAQYLTLPEEHYRRHSEIYDSLINAQLLEPLSGKIVGMKDIPGSTKNFVAPNGMNSIVKHFLNDDADGICFGHHVSALSSHNQKWHVETNSGLKDVFDVVILTMPVPQILQLSGTIQDVIKSNHNLENDLKSVLYSSRYALGLFFSTDQKVDIEWDAKYIYDHEIFRFVSVDNRKRNRPNLPMAIVFHTSVHYGSDNIERDLKDVHNELLGHVNELFPNWPEPKYVKCHRWRFSQVITPYNGKPGYIKLSESPLLLAGGDGFVSSHIEDCVSSALALTETTVQAINKDTELSIS